MRPSSVDKLDAPIRAEINRLRIECGFTIEQILEYLKSMSVDISKSALGRHVKKIAEVGARIREARAVAEGIAPAFADKDAGDVMRVNVELLQGAIMRLASATDDDGRDVQLKASEAMAIGRALKSSSKALAIDVARTLKVRQETAKKAVDAMTRVVSKEAPGLSQETIDLIRQQILGVAK